MDPSNPNSPPPGWTPGPLPPDPAAPLAPVASPPRGPVLGVRDHYRFAEPSVPQKAQITVLDAPKVPAELPSPTRIDPNFELLKKAIEDQIARNTISNLKYGPRESTRWFRFSPFETFMEQVLARKLWTLE